MAQAAPVIGQAAAQAVTEMCLTMPDAGAPMPPLFDLLKPQDRAA
jgi:hypothetical protein